MLPDGFSWSLYFAQAVSEPLCGMCEGVDGSQLFNDKSSPVVYDARPGSVNTNGITLSTTWELWGAENRGARRRKNRWPSRLTRTVWRPMATMSSPAGGDILGVEIDGENLENKSKLQKADTVCGAISAILRRRRICGWVLEVVIGHGTFIGLCNRGVLSCFHIVYKFIANNYATHAILWPSVIDELVVFSGCVYEFAEQMVASME